MLMYCLASPETQARLLKHVKGVAQSGINLSDLRTLPVAVPPPGEQAALVIAIEHALGTLSRAGVCQAESSSALVRLEAACLAKAFRGELASQDPGDEPAEALLARLRAGESTAERPSGVRKKRGKKSAA